MADIIDIRDRLRRAAEHRDHGAWGKIFRLRLCGPDLHWIGLVGGVLAEAFAAEGFNTTFDDLEIQGGLPVLSMRAGRNVITESGTDQTPGLVVAGAVPIAPLQGCDGRTVLLAQADTCVEENSSFPGTAVLMLPTSPPTESLGIAVASAAGAARLLGVLGWEAVERALREELTLSSGDAADKQLSIAREAYTLLSEWEGVVPEVPEELYL